MRFKIWRDDFVIADVGSLNKGGDGEKSAPLRKAGKSKRGAQILACAADGVADDLNSWTLGEDQDSRQIAKIST